MGRGRGRTNRGDGGQGHEDAGELHATGVRWWLRSGRWYDCADEVWNARGARSFGFLAPAYIFQTSARVVHIVPAMPLQMA